MQIYRKDHDQYKRYDKFGNRLEEHGYDQNSRIHPCIFFQRRYDTEQDADHRSIRTAPSVIFAEVKSLGAISSNTGLPVL